MTNATKSPSRKQFSISGLAKKFWIPLIIIVVVVVGGFTVMRVRTFFG
ncbi:hypothetical protein H8Z59_15240, partial [Mycolicibacterium fortuitum]